MKAVICIIAVASGLFIVFPTAAQDFSWVFPPYTIAYFQYRTVDIFANPDGVPSLAFTAWFLDEDPVYVVRTPHIQVVKPNAPYTSTSYIGVTQVSDLRVGHAARFTYVVTWTGMPKTADWEKLPPDYREAVEVEGESQKVNLIFSTGTVTAASGYQRRTLNFAAKTNDPHILVIGNLDWNPIRVLLPAGTNSEQSFTVCGKSTFVLVFYPNVHLNQLVFIWEGYKRSFEYIIKRIPENNP